ncbi:PLP-dependent transferase, partial [Streptococcus agalactiae]|nr:PLP-dependent transferase [Streptococcus agalactiae]
MKTMGLRMAQSGKSALEIAKMLEEHPAVKALHYPGLESHQAHKLHMSQASSGGAVLSFEVADRQTVNRLAQVLK